MDIGRCYDKNRITACHPDMVFKVVMTGDPCCGKTSLMFRYIKQWHKMPQGSTVGRNVFFCVFFFLNSSLKFDFWPLNESSMGIK